MSVYLAAQVLSSSIADALGFLQKHDANFMYAAATIKFIQIFDHLFDLMNARNNFRKGFKSPMTLKNSHVWEEVL